MKILINAQKLTIMIFALCLTTSNLQAMFSSFFRGLTPPWYSAQEIPTPNPEKTCDKLMHAVWCNETDKALAAIAALDRRGKTTEILTYSCDTWFWRSMQRILVVATEQKNTRLMQELLRTDRPVELRQRMLCATGRLSDTALMQAINNNDPVAVGIIIQAATVCGCLNRVLTTVGFDEQKSLLLAVNLRCNLEIIATIAQATINSQLFPDILEAWNMANEKRYPEIAAFLIGFIEQNFVVTGVVVGPVV